MKLINKREITQKLNENHYSSTTISVYRSWILRFVQYHNIKPDQFQIKHIGQYLSHLAKDKQLKTSTHNQALNAVVFFYQKILSIRIEKSLISNLRISHKENTLDTLSREQVENIIHHLKGQYQLLVYLLYGCGLRSSEALSLQVKDVNFDTGILTISNSNSYRTLAIPTKIYHPLNNQIEFVKRTYNHDIKSKFFNKSEEDNCYLFPMKHLCNDDDGMLIRTPIISNTLNYNITTASIKASIGFKVTAQTFRHSYAIHLLQNQISLKAVQKLLGHKHPSSTLIYSYITQKISENKALSPLDLN